MEPENIREFLYGLATTLEGLADGAFSWKEDHYLDSKAASYDFFTVAYPTVAGTVKMSSAVLLEICAALTNGDIEIEKSKSHSPTVWEVDRIHDIALQAGLTDDQAIKIAFTR